MRAPVAPRGWPRATAPPWTLNRSRGTPMVDRTAQLAVAKASLCSKRSMSSTVVPVSSRSCCTPSMGAAMTRLGSTPAVP